MENLLAEFLRKERITSVFKTSKATYKELTGVDIFYISNGRYFAATAFYTSAWISREPISPVAHFDGKIWMDTIYDVATISVYDNVTDWKSHSCVTLDFLQKFYDYVNECAKVSANRLLRKYQNLIYKVDFLLLPTPSILVILVDKNKYIGTVSITMDGKVSMLTSADDRMYDIIDYVSYNSNSQIYKEFMYVE